MSFATKSVRSCLILLFAPVLFQSFLANGAALHREGQASWRQLQVREGSAGFTRMLPSQTGVDFVNVLGTNRYTTNSNILNGSGVAIGDFDSDGLPDIFFAGLDGPNALLRNLGDWRFTNVAERAGVAMPNLDATGAAFADLDGDGRLDLIVNTLGQGTHVFRNNGTGGFVRVAMLNERAGGMSLALADTDGDGDLDLYITNYRVNTVRDDPEGLFEGDHVRGKAVIRSYNRMPATHPEVFGRFSFAPDGRIIEHGEPDVYYRNEGAFKFTHVKFESGAFRDEQGKVLESIPRDWGLSCVFRDMNGDGAPDLYVCNDFESPDRIWLNDGKGNFRAFAASGVRHTCMFSMGIDFADVNRDGYDDFFVADMLSRDTTTRHTRQGIPPYFHAAGEWENRPQYSQNMLYVNRGDGTFAETSWLSGVEASEWTWAAAFMDVDLDGWEDLLVTNGNQLDSMDLDDVNRGEELKRQRKYSTAELLGMRLLLKRLNTANVAFRNRGDLTFDDSSNGWGFNEAAVSHGMAFADLDLDGDLDVVINNLNGPASLLRSNSGAPRVAIRLKGAGSNTAGIGAKVRFLGGPVEQQQEIIAAGRYLSGDEAMRVFAAGSNLIEGTIEVRWRGGRTTTIKGVKANRLYEISESESERAMALIEEGSGAPAPAESGGGQSSAAEWFEDVSDALKHTHVEEPFEDFQRQQLLPMRLSQLGPGIAWNDFNGDGWDDLFIGTGRSGRMGAFANNQQGGFVSVAEPFLQRPIGRDQTTVIGVGAQVLIGSANHEDGSTNGGLIRIIDMGRKATGESILGPEASVGPMAVTDVDGDGSVELFIGGRAIAGRYPEPATSILFKSEGNRFVPKQRFEKLGLASGAVFSDLDQDGDPDLIVACHWGPVRVFANNQGTFTDATERLGLAGLTGLWNSVATGDFDGDGRPDIIAGNWGLNTRWKASKEHPLKLYYGDLDGNGIIDLVEARFDRGMNKEVPVRTMKSIGPAIPFVPEKMRTYAAYGSASVQEIYGEALQKAQVLQVTTLAATLFLNRGDRFEAKTMHTEAQFSPAFGICVADFDGDAKDDVFLAQNFFATNPEMPRSDAGRGLLLKGDGKGGFTPVPGQVSGIKVYGEQRGCAVADYDHDGRIDLVVTQNAAPTRLFRNRAARPGVRLKVTDRGGGPGIGTLIRVKGEGASVLREVQAGSGYWSMNSAVQVLPRGTDLEVRLSGGRVVQVKVAPEAKLITIAPDGSVRSE